MWTGSYPWAISLGMSGGWALRSPPLGRAGLVARWGQLHQLSMEPSADLAHDHRSSVMLRKFSVHVVQQELPWVELAANSFQLNIGMTLAHEDDGFPLGFRRLRGFFGQDSEHDFWRVETICPSRKFDRFRSS